MAATLSVLYVDDEPALLDIGKAFLEKNGFYQVTVAESGRSALNLMQDKSFDAVVSDYQMPGMDGLDFLREVRKDYGNIPFIIFTGRGREEVFIEAVESGVDFYVQKGGDPRVQFAELTHNIMHAVSGRRTNNLSGNEDESYRILLEELKEPAFIAGKSPDTKIIANKSFRSLLGLNDVDICDLSLSEIGIDDRIHREMLIASLQPDDMNFFDTGIVRSDGTLAGVKLGIRRILFRGDMALFVKTGAISNDNGIEISGSEADEGELSQIIENANSIIIKWTPDGVLTFFNSYAEKFFGYDKSEILGRNIIGSIVSERDQTGKDLSSLMAQIARDPVSFTKNENENITKDGRSVLISWTNSGVFDSDGKLCGIVSVGNEITSSFGLKPE